jgi:hypothetical protein
LTILDDLGDSLQTEEVIRVSDPIFSPIYFFGDIQNFSQSQKDLWSTRMDSTELRLYLSNDPRDADLSMPGFSLLQDSIYSDFAMSIIAKSGEDLAENRFADYSIVFGFEDENNYNYLQMKQTTSQVISVENGQAITIQISTEDGIPDADYHKVDLNLSGDQLTVLLDNSELFTSSSTRLLKVGKLGFGSNNYAVYFDDVMISGIGSPSGMNATGKIPLNFGLFQNYPNPFNPSTKISYQLPIITDVELAIYNSLGQRVTILVSEKQQSGLYKVEWNAADLPSGIYYSVLNAGDFRDVKKMILLK